MSEQAPSTSPPSAAPDDHTTSTAPRADPPTTPQEPPAANPAQPPVASVPASTAPPPDSSATTQEAAAPTGDESPRELSATSPAPSSPDGTPHPSTTTEEATAPSPSASAPAEQQAPDPSHEEPQHTAAVVEEDVSRFPVTRLPGHRLTTNDQMLLWDALFSIRRGYAVALVQPSDDLAPRLRVYHVVDANEPVAFGRLVWESATSPRPFDNRRQVHVALLPSGSLVLAQEATDGVTHEVLWQSTLPATAAPHDDNDDTMYLVEVTEEGALRVVSPDGRVAWSSSPCEVTHKEEVQPPPPPAVEAAPTEEKREEKEETEPATQQPAPASASASPSPDRNDHTEESPVRGESAEGPAARTEAASIPPPPPPERLPKHACVGDRIYLDDPLYSGSYLLCPSREYGFVIRRDGSAVVFRNIAPQRDYSVGRTRWVKPGTSTANDDDQYDVTVGDVIFQLAPPDPSRTGTQGGSDASRVEEEQYDHEYQLALLRDGDAVYSHFVLEKNGAQPNPDASHGTTPPVAVVLSEVLWTSQTNGSRATHLSLRDDGALVVAAPPKDDTDYYGVHAAAAAHVIVWCSTPASALVPFRPWQPPSPARSPSRLRSTFRSASVVAGEAAVYEIADPSTQTTEEALERLREAARQYAHVKVPPAFSPRRLPPSAGASTSSAASKQHNVVSPDAMTSASRQRQRVAERTAEFHSKVLYDERKVSSPAAPSPDETRAAVSERVMSRQSAAETPPPRVNQRSPSRRSIRRSAAGNPSAKPAPTQRHVVARGDVDVYV